MFFAGSSRTLVVCSTQLVARHARSWFVLSVFYCCALLSLAGAVADVGVDAGAASARGCIKDVGVGKRTRYVNLRRNLLYMKTNQ